MTDQSVTATVPFTFGKRGGRKLILTLDGSVAAPMERSRPDSDLLKDLARGFRWKKMLQEGDYRTLEDIADAENINPSYVSRLLRMTLLTPEIVEAILADLMGWTASAPAQCAKMWSLPNATGGRPWKRLRRLVWTSPSTFSRFTVLMQLGMSRSRSD